MVTTVLIGNGYFWTAGNKKTPKPIVTKFCTGNYVGLVDLCTNFGSNRLPGDFSAHAWNIALLSLFNALSIFPSLVSLPFPFFPAHVHRSNTWTNIDGCWLKRRVLTQESAFWVCEWWKNTLRGSTTPKTVAFFDPVGKSQPKLKWSIAFKRYNLATSL